MALWTKAQRMTPVALCSLCRSSHCGIVTCPGSSWISKSRTGVGVLIVFDQEQAWSWERLLLWVLESSEATCWLQTLVSRRCWCVSLTVTDSVSCWGELNIRQFIEDNQEHIRGALDALDALDALALQIHTIGYGSIVNTYIYIFSGMNIYLPAILMFTRGTRFWPIPNSQNSQLDLRRLTATYGRLNFKTSGVAPVVISFPWRSWIPSMARQSSLPKDLHLWGKHEKLPLVLPFIS